MSHTITRAHLAEAVHRKIGFSQTEAAELVDDVLDEMIEALAQKENVKLSSFGAFNVREKKERMGRNPKTLKEIPITARHVVSFRPSNLLVQRVNKKS